MLRSTLSKGEARGGVSGIHSGQHFSAEDNRKDYGEIRQITVGSLRGRIVIVGWVQRGDDRHVFTMRKANEREICKYREQFEQS